MAGRVYACAFGAKPAVRGEGRHQPEPHLGMNSFCRDDPAADAIPMVDRATVYAWRCAEGAPAIERQITEAGCPRLSCEPLVQGRPTRN